MIQKIHGKYVGNIQFFLNKIIVENNEIKLNDIFKIELFIGPKFGEYGWGKHKTDLSPRLSNGNSGIVWITKNDNTVIEKIFYLEKQFCFNTQFKQYLISYHLEHKISLIKLLEHLGIHDYKEIQKFKEIIYSK